MRMRIKLWDSKKFQRLRYSLVNAEKKSIVRAVYFHDRSAFVGVQDFVFSLKHWSRSDDETDSDRINEEGDNLLKYIAITVLFESVL